MKKVTSIYLKIMTNRLQLILLTASFDFSWPEKVLQSNLICTSRGVLCFNKPVSEVSSQIFSVDCFIDLRDSNSTLSEEEIGTDDHYSMCFT